MVAPTNLNFHVLISGGAAERAGLHAGDKILKVSFKPMLEKYKVGRIGIGIEI